LPVTLCGGRRRESDWGHGTLFHGGVFNRVAVVKFETRQ